MSLAGIQQLAGPDSRPQFFPMCIYCAQFVSNPITICNVLDDQKKLFFRKTSVRFSTRSGTPAGRASLPEYRCVPVPERVSCVKWFPGVFLRNVFGELSRVAGPNQLAQTVASSTLPQAPRSGRIGCESQTRIMLRFLNLVMRQVIRFS